eukprot:COSAG06_NODE_8780_length_2072_cov_31.261531_1_plen_113_part_00
MRSFYPATGDVDPSTNGRVVLGNVNSMGPFDKVALVFATLMVALAIDSELKDVELVSIAVKQAGHKLSKNWRVALTLLNGCRRRVFLPSLLVTVPILVMFLGGASSTCMLST